jgi:hypothetical protein
MDKIEASAAMRVLSMRKNLALMGLVGPARAAANAMMDANMKRTADPLSQALFELDAVDDEMRKLVGDNPAACIEALIDKLGEG